MAPPTNLLADGSFEGASPFTGWEQSGLSATVGTLGASRGDQYARLTTATTNLARFNTPTVACAPGQVMSVGLDSRAVPGGGTWTAQIQFLSSTSTVLASYPVTLSSTVDWVRQSVVALAAPASTTSANVRVARASAGGVVGDSIEIDAVHWSVGAYTGPYDPPNVIVVVLDDAATNDIEHMPKMRALRARGVRFTRFYNSVPVCSPSRAGALTGMFPHNNGVHGNGGANGSYKAFAENGNEAKTIFNTMSGLGYRCGYWGKLINGYNAAGGPDNAALYVLPGMDECLLTGGGYQGFNVTATSKIDGVVSLYDTTGGGTPEEEFFMDVITNRTKGFINRHGAYPFVAWLSPVAPHVSLAGDPEGANGPVVSVAPRDRPDSPSRPADWSAPEFPLTGDLGGDTIPDPDMVYPEQNNTFPDPKMRWLPAAPLSAAQMAANRGHHLDRVMALQSVDEGVDDIMAYLGNAPGRLDNTYVIFTSDNGFHLGEHGIPEGKGTPYDYDVRVPMIVHPPGGIGTPIVVDELTANIDLFPTIVRLSGAANSVIPAYVDGKSLAGLIDGGAPAEWRQTLPVTYYTDTPTWASSEGSGEPPSWQSLVGPGIQYVSWRYDVAGVPPAGQVEVFVFADDPAQMHNRVDDVDTASLADLDGLLRQHLAASGSGSWTVGLAAMTPTIEPLPPPPVSRYVTQTATVRRGWYAQQIGADVNGNVHARADSVEHRYVTVYTPPGATWGTPVLTVEFRRVGQATIRKTGEVVGSAGQSTVVRTGGAGTSLSAGVWDVVVELNKDPLLIRVDAGQIVAR